MRFGNTVGRFKGRSGLTALSACAVALAVLGAIVVNCCDSAAKAADAQKNFTETITTKIGEKISYKLVMIPGGTFTMGSPADEKGRRKNEGPQHKVTIKPFYMGTTEVPIKLFMAYYEATVTAKRDYETNEQAKGAVDAITGPTPVFGDMTMGYEDNHPAMGMTWFNATNFCKWLSKKTGRKYRLPTESEWEYACRAGSQTAYFCGDDVKSLGDYAWYEDNSEVETHPVAAKKPNAWGLYDMAGNVREWVNDFYGENAYAEAAKSDPAVDPKGPETGKVHVARGGDYTCGAEELRSAARTFEETWWRSGDPQIPKSKWWLPQMDFIGMRLAMTIDDSAKK